MSSFQSADCRHLHPAWPGGLRGLPPLSAAFFPLILALLLLLGPLPTECISHYQDILQGTHGLSIAVTTGCVTNTTLNEEKNDVQVKVLLRYKSSHSWGFLS